MAVPMAASVLEGLMLLPQPPFDTLVDPQVELWVTVVTLIGALVAAGFAVRDWRQSGRPTVLLLLIGGAAMTSIEPFIDTVGGCWFPRNGWTAFQTYGRPMPIWLICSYLTYFGGGMAVMWRLMRQGLSRSQLWALYAGGIASDCLLEMTLLHFQPYLYYGPQPLMVAKFPLWWAAINTVTPMAAAAILLRYERFLTAGWRQLQIVPLTLSVSIGMNAVIGWPSWLVINTPVGPLLTQIGGLASFALSAWCMSIVAESAHRQAARSPAMAGLVPEPS
jgi:hypothetical protein